jgi:nucleotide-binding universal stress UspA family protein
MKTAVNRPTDAGLFHGHSWESEGAMFQRIVVAYNDSPQSQRALASAIQLARSLNAELHTVTVQTDLPAYTVYAGAVDASITRVLKEDWQKFHEQLQEKAHTLAENHGFELRSHLVEGGPVEAIVDFLRAQKADLLVVGLHQRDLYIARLWSTVYELAQDAPCSVLGVH